MCSIIPHNEKGGALLIVMVLLLMTSLVAVSMFSVSDDEVSISHNSENTSRAFYSAEAGLAVARVSLWMDYVDWGSTNPQKTPGEIGSRDTYTTYLDQIGLIDSSHVTLVNDLDLSEGQTIDSVVVYRQDVTGATILSVTSTGSSIDNSQYTIRSVLTVEGEVFKGFEFAVLANNVNCIMCHARIDNVDRVYNTDPALAGTFDRVKVASLESMLIRTTSADSYIAGTLYTRGIVTDKDGNSITDLSPTGQGLEGYSFDGSDGKIQEPMASVGLTNTTGSPLPQFGNLYMNYPTEQNQMTDGKLPTDFPPPFPDDNDNKLVDQEEFDQLANDATGAITGGIIYGMNGNQKYTDATLPGAGNMTSITQSFDNNLLLVGTDANPIVINGNVAIDGDVVIQGVVKGTGQIFARGNVYVTGDLTYADGDIGGNRTFGTAADGTRNALSLAAGKNVLVGDYITHKDQDLADPNAYDPGNLSNGENFSFAMSEMTLFNRREWSKTQQFLPDANGDPVANGTYDPSYQPRYYTMNDGDPVYIFNKPVIDNGDQKGTYWDPASNSWKGKEHLTKYEMDKLTKLDPGDPQLVGASIVALDGTGGWISPSTLKNLWINSDAARAPGDPFKIDGQIYTNNSIFALTQNRSNSQGQMIVNGALVASDVGVLVPTQLNLNYDQRLKSFLKIKDDSKIVLTQTAWYAQ